MTDGIAWLAAPQPIACGGYRVVLARGLSHEELAGRLASTVEFAGGYTAVPVGEHTNSSFTQVLDDALADPFAGIDIGPRLGCSGGWVYAVACGCWPGEFGPLEAVSRDGAHVFLLEYEEENGKPVPPQFEYFHDDRLLSAFNLHLNSSWGYEGVQGDPATADRLQERLTAAGLPDPGRKRREVHLTTLRIVQDFFGLSLPRDPIVNGPLPAVLLEPA
ncbi:hypothetical protein [Streptomyces sp. NPDC047972]|uniref:hypothetical protein n=1 Tax=Streptomyces sp. NPDC047972 TaxID=3365493 RepID=UPI00372269A1